MKFVVFKDAKHEWRWNLKAKNGRVIACSGEGYKRRKACEKAVLMLTDLAMVPVVYR